MITERKVKLAERAIWWRGCSENIHKAKIKECEDKWPKSSYRRYNAIKEFIYTIKSYYQTWEHRKYLTELCVGVVAFLLIDPQ